MEQGDKRKQWESNKRKKRKIINRGNQIKSQCMNEWNHRHTKGDHQYHKWMRIKLWRNKLNLQCTNEERGIAGIRKESEREFNQQLLAARRVTQLTKKKRRMKRNSSPSITPILSFFLAFWKTPITQDTGRHHGHYKIIFIQVQVCLWAQNCTYTSGNWKNSYQAIWTPKMHDESLLALWTGYHILGQLAMLDIARSCFLQLIS